MQFTNTIKAARQQTALVLFTALGLTGFGNAALQAQDSAPDAPPALPSNYNPLQNLFTPQPQYPTPQTIMNSQPAQPEGVKNQLQNLFTPQPQYPTPQTIMNPNAAQPSGELNPLKGLFTGQPQYPTPQTIMNPDAIPTQGLPTNLPENPADATNTHATPADKSKQAAKPAAAKVVKKVVKKKAEDKKGKDKDKAQASPEDTTPKVQMTPLRDAIFYMNSGNYTQCLSQIDKYLAGKPGDAQGHYIKAVASVYLKKYDDARKEYQRTLDLSSDPKLQKLAKDGLQNMKN